MYTQHTNQITTYKSDLLSLYILHIICISTFIKMNVDVHTTYKSDQNEN